MEEDKENIYPQDKVPSFELERELTLFVGKKSNEMLDKTLRDIIDEQMKENKFPFFINITVESNRCWMRVKSVLKSGE